MYRVSILSMQLAALILGLTPCLTQAAMAKAETYAIDDDKSRDSVSFTSDAPLELIEGHTNKIKGSITVDDSLDLSKKPLEAQLDVDLGSIDTGISLRNEHMRDNFLQTAKYPKATFKATSITAVPTTLKDGETVKANASGEFTLHGVTVKRTIPVSITFHKNCKSQAKFEECDLIQIKSTFPIAFKDFNIQRPEIVFQKLADTVNVTVSATAHKAAAAAKKPTAPAPKSAK
jgi:polyisoprenoid-binding protein YceI